MQKTEMFRVKAVAYIDSGEDEEARDLLAKGIALLRPIVKEACKMYDTTLMLHKTPKLMDDIDKITKSYIELNIRTGMLRVLNPYIDLLGEMLNTYPGLKKAKKIHKEVL